MDGWIISLWNNFFISPCTNILRIIQTIQSFSTSKMFFLLELHSPAQSSNLWPLYTARKNKQNASSSTSRNWKHSLYAEHQPPTRTNSQVSLSFLGGKWLLGWDAQISRANYAAVHVPSPVPQETLPSYCKVSILSALWNINLKVSGGMPSGTWPTVTATPIFFLLIYCMSDQFQILREDFFFFLKSWIVAILLEWWEPCGGNKS